ncbi:hypothetical protein H4217_001801 [Coemansia sp. RSA 1939]|nr:hypothetical protein H4217_001801 [Coemansia sp. RSA 1939]KAJ2615234.1 hypothetical protein EV177_001664 [Coemansia sp. RSA 1804]KAJ2694327.1 hypothetical protein GGH99_000725 [Coemansia sp. RSA 1285]
MQQPAASRATEGEGDAEAPPQQHSPSIGDNGGRQWRGRDVVFVDPLDASAPFWWPAMVVPTDEIDATMGCSQLGENEYLVKYFEDNKYSTVRGSELRLFNTDQQPFTSFAASVPGFLRDRAIKSALAYLRTGHAQAKFQWLLWHTGSDALTLPFVLREPSLPLVGADNNAPPLPLAAAASSSSSSSSSSYSVPGNVPSTLLPASPSSRSSRSSASRDLLVTTAAAQDAENNAMLAEASSSTHAGSSAAESDMSTLVSAKNALHADPFADASALPPHASQPSPEAADENDNNNDDDNDDENNDDNDNDNSDDNGNGSDNPDQADEAERPVRSRRGRPKSRSSSRRAASAHPRTRRRSRSESTAAMAAAAAASGRLKSGSPPPPSDSSRQERDEYADGDADGDDENASDNGAKSLRRSATATADGDDDDDEGDGSGANAVDASADTPVSSGTAAHESRDGSTTPPSEDPARSTRNQSRALSSGRSSRRARQQQQPSQQLKTASGPPVTNGTGTGKRGRPPLHSRGQNQGATNTHTPSKPRRHQHTTSSANRRNATSSSTSSLLSGGGVPLLTIPDALLGKIPKSTTGIALAAAAAAAALAESQEAADSSQPADSPRILGIAKELEEVQEEYKFFRSLVRKSAKDLWVEMGNEWPPGLGTSTRFGKRRKFA